MPACHGEAHHRQDWEYCGRAKAARASTGGVCDAVCADNHGGIGPGARRPLARARAAWRVAPRAHGLHCSSRGLTQLGRRDRHRGQCSLVSIAPLTPWDVSASMSGEQRHSSDTPANRPGACCVLDRRHMIYIAMRAARGYHVVLYRATRVRRREDGQAATSGFDSTRSPGTGP